MAATLQDIETWFDDGLAIKATHMIVVCDQMDWEDYPVYVLNGENVLDKERGITTQSALKIMEVYKMALDKNIQLKTNRTFNY